jgi:hypothetical protein
MARSSALNRRPALAVLVLWLGLLGPYPCRADTSAASAWPALVDRFIETYFSFHPTFAVHAGRHEYDGKLPDWSAEGLAGQIEWLKGQRRTALAFDQASLGERQRFEQNYLISVIDGELFWLESVRWPDKNPLFYSGALDPNVYVSRPYAPLPQRLRAFIAYARNVPAAAAQIRANLRPPLPRTYIDVGKIVFGGLAKFYESDAKVAFAGVTDPELQAQFESAQRDAAKSMGELAVWLDQQIPTATSDYALGAERFREMLKATESVEIPLDVLEAAGKRDLDRNVAALEEACARLVPDAPIQQCVERVESDKPAHGPLETAREQLGELKAFVSEQRLVTIPSQDEASVAESPPHHRWNPAYIDIPGPFERGLPAIYYVAPPDPAWSPAEQAAYIPGKVDLLFISAHEVWPGHFLQFLHAHQLPSKFGQLFVSYGFAEGWAHYSEELVWEAGFRSGDAKAHVGQLLNALLRDVRFLSAIGLHTQGMTVETSERMFRELAHQNAANARQQAARGTFDPAYLNYTLGKLMIRKLRDEWTASRGGRKAWQQFHDALLSYGGPPLPLVRKAMLGVQAGSPL